MIKIYKYKICWTIPIYKDYKFNPEIKQLLNILGVKSLDYIRLMDSEYKTITIVNIKGYLKTF